ncbi:sterol desaturase family protein [Aliiglaciecola sp. LCG003]|uniref:sterol desaturase family protein n=1 Tax=Aliiglaciecola sp. LCG003 TaxID=3053655 RepID=UPI0025741F80|nr:sterol desaturase family protein [Aliiglaciecola sp. LCG003]WJG09200.1 sterol desaturase family protein [Aliiglaciecola sp. LCG003]
MNYQIVILIVFALFALKEAIHFGLFNKASEDRSDGIVEIASTILLFAFSQPLILFLAALSMNVIFPEYEGALANTAIGIQILLLLIFDDLTQYWWHRCCHSFRWLYNLHRAHHNAKYMSVRIVFRNNFFYYAIMPSLWCSGILIYLGLGWVYTFYLVVKLTVIIGAHAEWKWDKALYQNKYTSKPMWLVERLISTPSTHSSHHGYNDEDGITTYKGNYGNLLFFWDVLFGTAKITRGYPSQYGVKGMLKATWPEQLFWPVVPSALDKKKRLAKQAETIQ